MLLLLLREWRMQSSCWDGESSSRDALGHHRHWPRCHRPPRLPGLLLSTILSLLTISLSFLAALAGFLFSAHQLHVPADAPLVGLLCGIVPYWTLRLAADVLKNGADTLYLCYAIDGGQLTEQEQGAEERQTVREAFVEGKDRTRTTPGGWSDGMA